MIMSQHSWKSKTFKIFEVRFRFTVFNATFNNISAISWWSVLLVEETGVHLAMNGIRTHSIYLTLSYMYM